MLNKFEYIKYPFSRICVSVQPEVNLKFLVVMGRSIGIPKPRVPQIQDQEDRCSPCLERISNHQIESWSYFVQKMSSAMVVVFLHVHRTPKSFFNKKLWVNDSIKPILPIDYSFQIQQPYLSVNDSGNGHSIKCSIDFLPYHFSQLRRSKFFKALGIKCKVFLKLPMLMIPSQQMKFSGS